MLKVGFPIFLQNASDSTTSLFLVLCIGWIGKKELDSFNFSTVLIFITMIPLIAYGQIVSHAVNRALGKKRYKQASHLARYGLLTSVLVNLPLCIFASIDPDILIYFVAGLVTKDVLSIARKIIPAISAIIVLKTANYVMIQTLRTTNDLIKPTLLLTVNNGFGMIASYFLAFYARLGIYGAVTGNAAGTVITFLPILWHWYKRTSPKALEALTMPTEPNTSTQPSVLDHAASFCNAIKHTFFSFSKTEHHSSENMEFELLESQDNTTLNQ